MPSSLPRITQTLVVACRYLLVYDGLGHAFDGTNGAAMVEDVGTFLTTKLDPP